jgi:hypothetical protein
MTENWDYYELQKIKARLYSTYVLPSNWIQAEQWCYNMVGPVWHYIPFNIFDPLLGSQYYLFWTSEANRFYFKDKQIAELFQTTWGSTTIN